MNILHIDSSVSGEGSASRQISAAIVEALAGANGAAQVRRRDLGAEPVPHLSHDLLGTIRPDLGAAPAAGEAAKAAAVLDEFLAADVIVIGAPMYNFTVSTQLKAWIDRVLVAGKTFAYTEAGPKGLAGGKTVVIASTRGGLYGPGAPGEAMDFQETYLKAALGFIGVSDVRIVRAEGLAFGPDARAAAIEAALASVPAVVGAAVAKAA